MRELKCKITKRKKENSNQRIYKDFKRLVSREHGQNKQKTSPTIEVIDIRESNTSINLTKGHIMLMFIEASP